MSPELTAALQENASIQVECQTALLEHVYQTAACLPPEKSKRYLEAVLRKFRGDVSLAAEHASIERESFYRLLRRAGLSAEDFRDNSDTRGGDD